MQLSPKWHLHPQKCNKQFTINKNEQDPSNAHTSSKNATG